MATVDKQPSLNTTYEQAGAVPYRIHKGKLELCLITSMRRKRWCFPKGLIDPGETPEETALKESDEEAGLNGVICGKPLGSYKYRKWGRNLRVLIWLMKVESAATKWDEMDHRKRCWVGPEEAIQLLEQECLRELVHEATDRLGYSMNQ